MRTTLILCVAACLLGAALALHLVRDPGPGVSQTAPARGVAEALPAFVLERLEGGRVARADLDGRIVVLDFWASWCAPCEFQVPGLNAFFDAHRSDSDVVLYGVSVDVDRDAKVRQWVSDKGVRYPVLLGGEDLARALGAVGFPSLFIVAPDGTVHADHVGVVDVEVLEGEVAALRARFAAPATL